MLIRGNSFFKPFLRPLCHPCTFLSKKISYVERMKYMQVLKDCDRGLLQILPSAKFLLFDGSKPLLTNNFYGKDNYKKLIWLDFAAISRLQSITPNVFLNVDENSIPYFGVKLEKNSSDKAESLLEDLDGSFFDLRLALFSVNWRDAHCVSQANSLFMFNKNNAFCGKCGSPTYRNASGNIRTCKSCSQTIHPISNPVGIVLVTDISGSNTLLVRQHRIPQGRYTCIAGFGEVGETLEDFVKREVAEEVGLEVKSVSYAASQHWPFPGSFMIGCYAIADNTLPLSLDTNELEDAKWYSKSEIEEAVELAKTNTSAWLKRPEGYKGLLIPPRGAIAFRLMEHWLKGTPSHEVQSHIY